MSKKILLIIDAQNDFITGSLAVENGASFVEEMTDFIENHFNEYDSCVLTKDWHPETHCSFKENGGMWPTHCVAETDGADVHSRIIDALDEVGLPFIQLEKGTNEDVEEYSIFNNPSSAVILDDILKDADEIHICGIAYDYCVKETIKDALKRGYKDKLVVLRSLCPSIGDRKPVDNWLGDEEIKTQRTIKRIINHFTDNDLYTFTVMYYAMVNYPHSHVKYSFFDRNHTNDSHNLVTELRKQVDYMKDVVFTDEEFEFMSRMCPYFPKWFLTYLKGFRFNPEQVKIGYEQGQLRLTIEGPWCETIIWEVILLAMISELRHILNDDMDKVDLTDVYNRQYNRIKKAFNVGVRLSEMGTRRRFSFDVQKTVLKALCNADLERMGGNLIGTSNVYFAMKFGLKPVGTMSHQVYSFEECVTGVLSCNRTVLEKWRNTYHSDLAVALPDTFGNDVFIDSVPKDLLMSIDSLRIDSGDELTEVQKFYQNFISKNIDPQSKQIILSNALTLEKAAEMHPTFNEIMTTTFGIGTDLTACVYNKETGEKFPYSNIVIKLVAMCLEGNINKGCRPCVKLSCDTSKAIGNVAKIEAVKNLINLYCRV